MTESLELRDLITTWLREDAPARASERVLEGAMDRVTTTPQDRYWAQRVFGDTLGRRPQVRVGLAAVLALVALAGAVVVAGALWPARPSIPTDPASNGAIVFAANGKAGADLSLPIGNPRNGEFDLYLVTPDGPRRIVGTDDDAVSQACPAFSPDGTRLAYLESSGGTLVPTPAPVPAGQTFAPAAPPVAGGPFARSIAIVPVDRDGRPAGGELRLPVPASQDTNVSCPAWSPDGQSLAYTTDPEKDVWIVTLGGLSRRIIAPDISVNDDAVIAWSPDGRTLAYPYGDRLWFLPVDGGEPSSIVIGDTENVAWSPDGTSLLYIAERAAHVIDRGGLEQLTIPTPENRGSTGFWAPDGRSFALLLDGRIVIIERDGAGRRELPFDPALTDGVGVGGIVAWSPDGRKLLVSVGGIQERNGIVAVPVAAGESPQVLVAPANAVAGGTATWQVVRP